MEHAGTGGEGTGAQDTAAFWAVMSEPLGLPDDELPSYDVTPQGTCAACHLGPLYKNGRCLYCWTLDQRRLPASVAVARPAARNARGQFVSGHRHQPGDARRCQVCGGHHGHPERILAARLTLLGLGMTLMIAGSHMHPQLYLLGLACFVILWRSRRWSR
jgi:hypothetical protein